MDVEILLFSKKQAAAILGLSLRTIDYLIARKEIVARRIGRRVMIHRGELERFARRDHLLCPSAGRKVDV